MILMYHAPRDFEHCWNKILIIQSFFPQMAVLDQFQMLFLELWNYFVKVQPSELY